MTLPKRKRNRLQQFNYGTAGAYFITICVDKKETLLGKIVGGGVLDAPKIHLSALGRIIERQILSINNVPCVTVDHYVVMPNHIHLLLLVAETKESIHHSGDIIPQTIGGFKRLCEREIGRDIFQRSYHDHIIRRDVDYQKIWQYIDTNPIRWNKDCFFVHDIE